MKKDKKIKIQYHFIKPKTEEEAREAQRQLDAAYDILFDTLLKDKGKKDSPTT